MADEGQSIGKKLLSNLSVGLLNLALSVLILAFSVFFGLSVWAWFQNETVTFAGYDFGRPGPGIKPGAVVAYDLPNGCPEGWATFVPSTGRVIVGAGSEYEPSLERDEESRALTARRYNESGGSERETLTVAELPAHSHPPAPGTNFTWVVTEYQVKSNLNWPHENRPGWFTHNLSGQAETGKAGADQPHNNMPPYVALYYCRKE